MTLDIDQAITVIKALIVVVAFTLGALGFSVDTVFQKREQLTFTQAQVAAVAEAYAEKMCGDKQ